MKTYKKPLLELKNISVKFDDLIALNHINLNIYEGDFIYIIGPNGAGKSTLIKLITNVIKPSSGEAVVSTKSIGYLPQLLNQKPNFPITVNEVIYTGFKKQSLIMLKSDLSLINEWLLKMNIEHTGNKLMQNLSGGQQQRVFLIRSLISNPKLLILDEPTSALDPSFRAVFYALLDELHEKGTTIIFVTHDINEQLKSRKVIFLDQEIMFEGDYQAYQAWGGHHHA